MVAGGFAGGIGAIGRVAVLFGKGGVSRIEGTVNFVCGNVQEAKGTFAVFRQRFMVMACGFQEAEGADDVGLDEVFGAVDGAVHMAFRREVDDGPDGVFFQERRDQFEVGDIALDKAVAVIALQRSQILAVAGVGEFIQVDDGFIRGFQPVEHEIGADKTGTTGD